MDDSILESLRGFGNVWGRVSGEGNTGGTEDDLRRLMCGAARLCESLNALARRYAPASAKLRRLAGCEAAIVRRLRAELYLLTGETCSPPAACAYAPCAITMLRAAYLAAGESAADFAASARRAPDGTACLLDGFAAKQRRAGCELRELILCAMGAISS